jgi:hypothetical protein
LLNALGQLTDLQEAQLRSGDVQSLLAGKLLCGFYAFSQGMAPSQAEWVRDVRREVKRGLASRYLSPYDQ